MRIRHFSTDLDGTLLGNPESTHRFRETWRRLPGQRRPSLSYNSGRLVEDVLGLVERGTLPEPDYIVGGVGTQLYDVQAGRHIEEYNEVFGQGWDLAEIERILARLPGIVTQPPEFLHPYKSSWYLAMATEDTLRELREALGDAGLDVNVVYSSQRYLDVLPGRANKGTAVEWLARRLGISHEDVLVAGDSGNDSAMFLVPGVQGLVVENAQPDLLRALVHLPCYVSHEVMADGVLSGLKHYGIIDEVPEVDTPLGGGGEEADPSLLMLVDAASHEALSTGERSLVREGYARALVALRKNITPLGFSACSLEDNEVVGTDENYRSVWARDGAITVVQTVLFEDADIRACQRQTLRTLLDNMTPTGLLPANVRIDSGLADYSGVGGICSIDSGLWVIIAVYNYVRATKDWDFLREYAGALQRAMDWLSAHDSNNDGLLEIPEAGDWTDLFGRSYNVLYDEILWFRANVCYGGLLEYLGDYHRAADYLGWAQTVRTRILKVFWPSTNREAAEPLQTFSFADSQFSLGDARYLISEVSPFGFSWRCDVLGNVLAFLCNLLDADRARVAFKFMWGVGVNDPFPVANLYPTVQAGDPEWKPYYTVNLLNLPHHYHNGGLWPFIGGMWVRFIHRLGLHDVAARELVKLAQLNRQGRNVEWEFNEWAHGRTGRPMGKAFQAWSAASYLRACQELGLVG